MSLRASSDISRRGKDGQIQGAILPVRDTAQTRDIAMFGDGMVFDVLYAQSLGSTVFFERVNEFLAQIPTLDFPVKRAFRAIAAPCRESTD